MLPVPRGLGLQSLCQAAVADDAASPDRRIRERPPLVDAAPPANAVGRRRRRVHPALELQGIKGKEVRTWTSKAVARSPPAKDWPSILPARCALTPCSRQPPRHARSAPVSRSSPALAPRGTPTRWARP